MINESLVVCYSTPNYKKLTDICIQSLLDIGFKHEQIKHFLDTITEETDFVFRQKIWYKSIINKVIHLTSILNNATCKYLLFTDCDIRYIKKNRIYWDELKQYIENTSYDIYFTDDLCGGNINSGFYIIKVSAKERLLPFFNAVINQMKLNETSEDQVVINQLKHTIHYGYIPNEYIILGKNIVDKNKSLLHHAVCEGSITGKIKQMNYIQSIVDTKYISLGLNCAIVDAIQLLNKREYSYPFDYLWTPGKTTYTIINHFLQHGLESTITLMTTGFNYCKFLGKGDYISVDTVTECKMNKETGLGITHFNINDEFKDKLRRRFTRFLSDIYSNKIIFIYGDSPCKDLNYNIDDVMYGDDASEYLIKIYDLLYQINPNINIYYFCWKERSCANNKITYIPYETYHNWENIRFVISDFIKKNELF